MRAYVVVLFCLMIACACFAQVRENSPSSDVVATIGGRPVYKQDLMPEIGSKFLELQKQQYDLESNALENLIRKRVIEAEAGKRGISPDQLQQKEVDSKVPDVSDPEVAAYYLAVKSQISQPFDEIKPQLQKFIKILKIQQARQEYADSLRAKADVVLLLQPPKVDVRYDASRIRGDANAPITIVEFSDFQCPYCKKAAAALDSVLAKYKGQVKLSYRDFPMRSLHARAEAAAEAAHCAGDQNKFWEFHDALFADQTKLDDAGLMQTARRLGLNESSFTTCLRDGKFKEQIEEDVQAGTRAGVNGTPGFFINGEFLSGAQPEAEFEKIIDRELAIAANRTSAKARSAQAR